MGKSTGTFDFYFNTYDIPDAVTVSQDGHMLLETGCVGDSKTKTLELKGTSSRVTVQVIPNCKHTKGTGWNFTVACPK